MVADDRLHRIIGILSDSFFPILQAGLYFTIPLTLISFVLGILLAFFTALGRLSNIKAYKCDCEILCVDFSRHAIVGPAFHPFLRATKHGNYFKSIPGSGDRIYPECRCVQLGNYSCSNPVDSKRTMGGSFLDWDDKVAGDEENNFATGCKSIPSAIGKFVY